VFDAKFILVGCISSFFSVSYLLLFSFHSLCLFVSCPVFSQF
jgi:hypothetical protein